MQTPHLLKHQVVATLRREMNPFNDVVLSSDELEQVQREVLGMWGCECESDVWECLRH